MTALTGKCIVVTGGTNGIGLATAGHLARCGARVVLLDHDLSSLEDSRKLPWPNPDEVFRYQLDVTDRDATFSLSERIESAVGAVWGLVACAGITGAGPSQSMSEDTWRRVIAVNLDGTFYSCQVFGTGMISRGRGAIATVSSVYGLAGQAMSAHYAASKWGVIGLTKTLAIEWGKYGLRCNCIAPGPVNTELFRTLPDRLRDEVILARTPLGRAAEADELARAVAFLLSDDASFISGAVLAVDDALSSGFTTQRSGPVGRGAESGA